MYTIGAFSRLSHVSSRMLRHYDALCAWLGEHPEYKVCGPSVERYLKDEGSVSNPEDLETGVLLPVERVK